MSIQKEKIIDPLTQKKSLAVGKTLFRMFCATSSLAYTEESIGLPENGKLKRAKQIIFIDSMKLNQ